MLKIVKIHQVHFKDIFCTSFKDLFIFPNKLCLLNLYLIGIIDDFDINPKKINLVYIVSTLQYITYFYLNYNSTIPTLISLIIIPFFSKLMKINN